MSVRMETHIATELGQKTCARSLLQFEIPGGVAPPISAAAQRAAINSVCEKLRCLLSAIAGAHGFRSQIVRAHSLAVAEVPWFHAVQFNAAGALEGIDLLDPAIDPSELARGGEILVSRLIGLLVIFIGDGLTVSILHEIWPQIGERSQDQGES